MEDCPSVGNAACHTSRQGLITVRDGILVNTISETLCSGTASEDVTPRVPGYNRCCTPAGWRNAPAGQWGARDTPCQHIELARFNVLQVYQVFIKTKVGRIVSM